MTVSITVENEKEDVILAWTDGATRNTGNTAGGSVNEYDKGAYGYYMNFRGAEKSDVVTNRGCTNNYNEIKAVILLLSALKTNKYPIKIHSDSAYVVNAINDGWYKKWRINGWDKEGGLVNREEWIELIGLIEQFDVQMIKVKGHSNNKYNNLVDRMLNDAMDIQK